MASAAWTSRCRNPTRGRVLSGPACDPGRHLRPWASTRGRFWPPPAGFLVMMDRLSGRPYRWSRAARLTAGFCRSKMATLADWCSVFVVMCFDRQLAEEEM